MRHDPLPRVTGRCWRLRGLWPDRNPLRRAVDRVEAVLMAGLVAAFLIGAPLVAVAAGQWSYAVGLRVERAQQSAWHQVPAVLLADAPSRGYAGYTPQVRARWTARNGTQRSGDVDAPAGARAGRTVLVWADASGRLTGPPLRHGVVTFGSAWQAWRCLPSIPSCCGPVPAARPSWRAAGCGAALARVPRPGRRGA
jgi:hypothetical protein